ncbi:MAG: protein UsfY [Mycobacterium sp.]
MGDTFHDPVDHMRTTRPHAGRAVIDVVSWPGYLLVVLGMVAGVGCLVAFGTGHDPQGEHIAVVAVITVVVGVLWLLVEHKRIRRVHDQWHLAHPEMHRQQSSH